MARRQIFTDIRNFFRRLVDRIFCRVPEREDDELLLAGPTRDSSSKRDVVKLRTAYLNTVRNIWLITNLEESLKESCYLEKFHGLRAFYENLPKSNDRQWGNFLQRHPGLERAVETFSNEPTSPTGLDQLKRSLRQTREDLQSEAASQLSDIKQQGPKIARDFPELETSPINLKGKRVNTPKVVSRQGDDYEEKVRSHLLEDFPGICTEGYCCPDPAVYCQRSKNSKRKCLRKVWKSMKSSVEGNSHQTVSTDPVEQSSAPSKVVTSFESLLEEMQPSGCGKPFVIFTSYQFQSALKHVENVRVCKEKFTGDIDILIVSRRFGLIAGELKCSALSSSNWGRNMSEADFQIFKAEGFLNQLFRDKPDILEIPVHHFIALPLIQDSSEMKQRRYLNNFDPKKLLFKHSLDNDESFGEWFHNLVECDSTRARTEDDRSMTEEQYLTIMERLVGFGSDVKGNSKQHKSRVEGNKQFHHPLTSSQEEIIEDSGKRFVVIGGDYGTGKSLMLVRKAQHQRDKVGGAVAMVSCADIAVSGECVDGYMPEHSVHHLQRLLRNCYRKEISVQSFWSFLGCPKASLRENMCLNLLKNAVNNLKQTDDKPLSLFFDEVPVNFLSKQYFQDFLKWLCDDEALSNLTVWFTIATHSYRASGNTCSWFRRYLPKDFHYVYLDEVLRTPKCVNALKKAISSYCNDTFDTKLVKDAEKGSMPLLYRVPSCKCSPQMKKRKSHFTSDCVKKRMESTLKMIFYELKKTTPKQGDEDLDLSKIVLIVSNVECTELEKGICKLLEESCKQLSVNVNNEVSGPGQIDKTSKDKSILLTKDRYYISCERHIVICVDISGMKHWFKHGKVGYTSLVVSRCLSAYIHLTFQEEEANILFGWDMEAAKQDKDETLCRKIDEALENSTRPGCLQSLLKQNVIKEMPVESQNTLTVETSV